MMDVNFSTLKYIHIHISIIYILSCLNFMTVMRIENDTLYKNEIINPQFVMYPARGGRQAGAKIRG